MELYRFDSQPGAAGNYTLDQAATTSRFASPQVGRRAGAAVAIRPAQRMFCAQGLQGFPAVGWCPAWLIDPKFREQPPEVVAAHARLRALLMLGLLGGRGRFVLGRGQGRTTAGHVAKKLLHPGFKLRGVNLADPRGAENRPRLSSHVTGCLGVVQREHVLEAFLLRPQWCGGEQQRHKGYGPSDFDGVCHWRVPQTRHLGGSPRRL